MDYIQKEQPYTLNKACETIGIKIADVQQIPARLDSNWKEAIHFHVVVAFPREQFHTLQYSMGYGHFKRVVTCQGVMDATEAKKKNLRIEKYYVLGNELPTVHAVMYSLLSDAQCGDESFENFCANCGYDDDSRKAESIWRSCNDIHHTLRKLLTPAELETLYTASEDY